ncbi:helix-turn-helix protein [Hydrogenispora ethanolica]|uniref:Helix-turn-helix protein n=1 Tax=Hydrogenispora ethanolica TaxID=1082276 RepID=A0A4R1S4Q1_HYDET|nr:helix-turn-helix transcriptional regulator [Hydrogenispora ethanolica]TCL74191.1 helix-turn-helix protein [Hydrogenispora ethanolica]
MTFGARLKSLRNAKTLSQMKVSDATGIPQTTLSDLENDKYLPDIEQILKIAGALGTTTSYLLGESQNSAA